jgi:glycosyltransferase 2 family protein
MNKLNAALLGLGLAFLAFLVWTSGPKELWHQVGSLGWGVVPLIASEGVANLAHTAGWRRCLSGTSPRVPLLQLFRMAMAGFAINYLTPTASLGGEVSKAALLASTCKGADAVSSVLIDKLSLAFGHLVLVILGSLFLLWRVRLPAQLWIPIVAASLLLTAGMVIFLAMQRQGKMGGFLRWLAAHGVGGQALQKAAQQISEVDEVLKRFYRERAGDLLMAVGWHTLGHAAAFFQTWLFLYALDQPAPLSSVISAGVLSLWLDLLAFAIPLNLGSLEGSRILALKAVGCEAVFGLAFGVAVRMAQVFWACFGLANYGWFAMRKPAPLPAETAVPGCVRCEPRN